MNTEKVSRSISQKVVNLYWTKLADMNGFEVRQHLNQKGFTLIAGKMQLGLDDTDPDLPRFAEYVRVTFSLDKAPVIENRLPRVKDDTVAYMIKMFVIPRFEPYRLYIDDIRVPQSDGWVIARTSEEAMATIKHRGCPMAISFDHDLGGDDTTIPVVKQLIEFDLDVDGKFIPDYFEFNVHSANPVGRENIIGLLDGYLRDREESRENEWLLNPVNLIAKTENLADIHEIPKLNLTCETIDYLLSLPERRMAQILKLTNTGHSAACFYQKLNETKERLESVE